jgi:uncharacterized membrane-anchored protein
MPDNRLGELGLINELQGLIEAKRARAGLFEDFKEAERICKKNEEYILSVERKLGAHTRQTERPEIVVVMGLAAYIPVPHQGYTDTKVDVVFTIPKGIRD